MTDPAPPAVPMFVARIGDALVAVDGHLVVDTAQAWTGQRVDQLLRVPPGTQGVRVPRLGVALDRWWESR